MSNEFDARKYFNGLDYPAVRDDLVRIAAKEGATADELRRLRALPDGGFSGSHEIMLVIPD